MASQQVVLEPESTSTVTSKTRVGSSADEICDILTEHMLECEECLNACLDGNDETCPVYFRLKEQLKRLGGASNGSVLFI